MKIFGKSADGSFKAKVWLAQLDEPSSYTVISNRHIGKTRQFSDKEKLFVIEQKSDEFIDVRFHEPLARDGEVFLERMWRFQDLNYVNPLPGENVPVGITEVENR